MWRGTRRCRAKRAPAASLIRRGSAQTRFKSAILKLMENANLLFPDETYAIRGALFEVYREVGNGLREEVYQQCLEREFALRSIPFEAKKELRIIYKGEPIEKTYIQISSAMAKSSLKSRPYPPFRKNTGPKSSTTCTLLATAWGCWPTSALTRKCKSSLGSMTKSLISQKNPSRRRRFPNLPGAAKGRAPGTATHEACFNVAWDTAQPREARPGSFPDSAR